MTPRPIEPPPSAFAAALAHARDGRCADAVLEVSGGLGADADDAQRADAARTLAQIARLAESAGETPTALAALDRAVECCSGWADLHLQRARACIALDRRAAAREALASALRINPRYVAARLESALLDAREGLIGEALDALRALARETQVHEPRTYEQGLESLERADGDEAGARFRRALHLAEPELDVRLERFQALMDSAQVAAAAQLLREVLPRYDAYPDLHFRLGTAELREGWFDDALVSLARALELNPDFHAARLLLARTLDAMGMRAQALEQVSLVLQRAPDDAQARALEAEWTVRSRAASARENSRRKGA